MILLTAGLLAGLILILGGGYVKRHWNDHEDD